MATYSAAELDTLISQGDFVIEAVPVTVKISFLTHPISQTLLFFSSIHKFASKAILVAFGKVAAEKTIHHFVLDTGNTVQVLQAVNELDNPAYFITTLEESLNPLVIDQFPVGHPGFITGYLDKTWTCTISSGCSNVYRVRTKLDNWNENYERWHYPAGGTYSANTISSLLGSHAYSLGTLPECIAKNASSNSLSGNLEPSVL